MMSTKLTQKELVKEYFMNNPLRNIEHPEVVDWLTQEWSLRNGPSRNGKEKKFRDPDRAIRKLYEENFLQKISKGVYKYDPDYVKNRKLENFTPAQKEEILKRDNYRCVICGKSEAEGIELQVDHIKAKDRGGVATVENGQTLCAQHNFKKKNYKQTEMGKNFFIRLYELSKKIGDIDTRNFCARVLDVYEEHNEDDHIKWKR